MKVQLCSLFTLLICPTVGLDRQPRWNDTEDNGGHVQAGRGKSTECTPGGAYDRGVRRGPRGRRGGTARATEDRHLPRTSPMRTRREGRRGRVAATAHQDAGGAQFCGPEHTKVARESGKTGERCDVRQFP